MKHDYLLLGEVVRPQGIHGEVKLRHYTDDPERFLELKTVYRERDGRYEPIGITGARVREDDVFLMLEGVRDRNAAEALRDLHTARPLPGAFHPARFCRLPRPAQAARF